MDLTEKLTMGKVLMDILDVQTNELNDPFDDKLPEIISRAIRTQLQMEKFYLKQDKPPEMVEQLEKMSEIIKRLTELQNNKKCY